MWRATLHDIHGLSTEIAVKQPHSDPLNGPNFRNSFDYEKLPAALGRKKGVLPTGLLQNQHMRWELAQKI
jgi:hypothetical protein